VNSADVGEYSASEPAWLDQTFDRPELALLAADEGVWDWDLRAGTAYLSDRYYAISGFQRGEVEPTLEFLQRLVHPEDWSAAWRAISDHLEGRTSICETEYRLVRKDGRVLWIAGKGRVVERDAAGAPVRMIGVIADITSRKEVDEERALHDAFMGSLIEGFLVVDSMGIIRYTNARMEQMFGYAKGEMLGMPVEQLNAGDDDEAHRVFQDIMQTLMNNRVWQGEVRNRCKDGRLLWTEARIAALTHPRFGNVWATVQWDITEQRRQVDDMVEAIAEAVIMVAADGVMTRINGRVTEMFGYRREELIGQPLELLLPSRLLPLHSHMRWEFAHETRTRMMGENRELFGLRKDGSEFPVEVGLGPMQVGARRYSVVSVADISVLRQSERQVKQLSTELSRQLAERTEELRISEHNFAELVQHLKDVFFLASPDFRRIFYISPTVEEVFGVCRDELMRDVQVWTDRIHVDDRAAVQSHLARAAAGDPTALDMPDYRIVVPDSSMRWVRTRSYVVRTAAGDVHRVAGILQDITPQKLAEERLRAAEELHASAERKKVEDERRRLSLELHDEVVQMLAALNMSLELIRRRNRSANVEPPLHNAVAITAEVVASVRRIVHQLRPPQLDDLGLVAAVRDHLHLVQRSGEVEVVLHEDVGPRRLPPGVEMAGFRLVQESVSNCLRHAGATRIEVMLAMDGAQLTVQVLDDGQGFDATDDGLNRLAPTHLGLRGMQERAQDLGGTFRIRSSAGCGCRVWASFPIGAGDPVQGGASP
jgi:PAS domain S-box-containing protein